SAFPGLLILPMLRPFGHRWEFAASRARTSVPPTGRRRPAFMTRPTRKRRRHRPGRRPPNRYSGPSPCPAPRGYTGPGFRQLCDASLPLHGRQKREFFNTMSVTIVLVGGVMGAWLGGCWLGPLGALLGLVIGIGAGGAVAEQRRFYRG